MAEAWVKCFLALSPYSGLFISSSTAGNDSLLSVTVMAVSKIKCIIIIEDKRKSAVNIDL